MRIAFDAKRAFHNQTGLGHYSRTLIHSLAKFFPHHEYLLCNPRHSDLFSFDEKNVKEILPTGFPSRLFTSAWRSNWVKKDLKRLNTDIYHGLSHEIPMAIHRTGIRSVVTIHDLIHERYPHQYNPIDVKIYRAKFKYACEHSDRVIAISEQTKADIIEYYKTPEQKITVCYQSCHPAFADQVPQVEKERVKRMYGLPERFFLQVGSIIERKNLLSVCIAMKLLRDEFNIPLVVIGNGGDYKKIVTDYIKANQLEERVIFLSDCDEARKSTAFQKATDFPAIYQSSLAMLYPSFFEGFGIPVLEALWSRVPVITSNVSCLPEAGGDGALYVNPSDASEIAQAMKRILTEPALVEEMKNKGWVHAQKFTQEKCAKEVMDVYTSLNR